MKRQSAGGLNGEYPQPWIARECSLIQSAYPCKASLARGSSSPRPFGPTFIRRFPPIETMLTRIWISWCVDFHTWSSRVYPQDSELVNAAHQGTGLPSRVGRDSGTKRSGV